MPKSGGMKSKKRSTRLSAFAVYNSRLQVESESEQGSSKVIEHRPKSSKKRKLVKDSEDEQEVIISEDIEEEEVEDKDDESELESIDSVQSTPPHPLRCSPPHPLSSSPPHPLSSPPPHPLSSPAPHPSIDKSEKVPCGNIEAERYFQWLIEPSSLERFFNEMWEKVPLHIRRFENYYKNLLTCEDFDKMLRKNHIDFGKHVDVVRYVNGERKTATPEGRAYASAVWSFFQEGYSIRMLNPQTYHNGLWKLCSMLQEFFGSYVGMNLYLTPPGAQGFAPHYDDIDAFVLQLEGKKHWKLHLPRSDEDILPRFSSGNLSESEIGAPDTEILMEPGHLLYFPRGQIHQAKTVGNEHSLHITLSVFQKNTWGDLLLLLLPSAVQSAMENSVEFRKSVPKDFINFVGVANANNKSPQREMFLEKVKSLSRKVLDYLPIDKAADDYAVDFIHGSMPPFLTIREKSCSIHGKGYIWKDGKLHLPTELGLNTKIRLIRKQAFRMVYEESSFRLYYTLENSKDHKELEKKYIDLENGTEPALEYLFKCYPKFTAIRELPLETDNAKIVFSNDMYSFGFLMTEEPDELND